jgi:geranylgeranyl pyrophosphate synthase
LAVARSVGLERTRHLALLHLRKALDSLTMLPHDSKAVQALGSLARLIYERVK